MNQYLINKWNFKLSHLFVYFGFLTTAIIVKPKDFFIYRFFFIILAVALTYFLYKGVLILNKQIFIFCVLALIFSLISAFHSNVNIIFSIRSSIGLILVNLAVFSYYKINKYNVFNILRHYLCVALMISCLGIAQQLFFMIDVKAGYDLSWILIGVNPDIITVGPFMRVNSFFTEPGYYAVALTPAVFLAINSLTTDSSLYLSRLKSIIIIFALLISFSIIGYVGIILSILFNYRRRYLVPIGVLLVFIIVIIGYVKEIQSRIIGITAPFKEEITGSENVSSLILYTNYLIAKENFLNSPYIGSGLDSFQFISQTTLSSVDLGEGVDKFLEFMDPEDMNYRDASTMYFKLPAELGIIGCLLVIWFFYRNRVSNKLNVYKTLQKMCLVFFAVFFLRTGQYIRFELWYFIGFYYSCKRFSDANTIIPSFQDHSLGIA